MISWKKSFDPSHLLKQGQIFKDCIQLGFQYLKDQRRLYNLSRQSSLLLDHPHSKILLFFFVVVVQIDFQIIFNLWPYPLPCPWHHWRMSAPPCFCSSTRFLLTLIRSPEVFSPGWAVPVLLYSHERDAPGSYHLCNPLLDLFYHLLSYTGKHNSSDVPALNKEEESPALTCLQYY